MLKQRPNSDEDPVLPTERIRLYTYNLRFTLTHHYILIINITHIHT